MSHPNNNFALLLESAAAEWPARTVIVDQGRETTFRELHEAAGGVAIALQSLGVGPGDRVAIMAPRGRDSAAAFFGTLATGAIACMINEMYRARQVRYVLEHTGARVVLADGQWPMADGLQLSTLDLASIASAVFKATTRVGSDPAQIIYTSGSTGQPKGVVASHGGLWAGAEIVPEYLGLRDDDRIASVLPFSFVYGFSQLACALVSGATLVIEGATLPRDLVASLRDDRISVLAGVPPLWMQLLDGGLEDGPLPHLRVATCAGGKLAPELVRRLRAAQPQVRLFLMYGLTEVFRSTSLPPELVDAHPDSMGRAVPRSEVMVLREDGAPCAPGEVGELVHRGPTVALGYWQDETATAQVFRPLSGGAPDERVVHSGDLVRRDEEGLIYYVGRRDRMLKTLGYRVSPDEVCDVLLASGMLREAAVTGAPDRQRGTAIIAHVVLADGADLTGVKRFCGQELPRYMQPARYRVMDKLPRNPNGKIDLVRLSEDGQP